jgi:hypothetical protein
MMLRFLPRVSLFHRLLAIIVAFASGASVLAAEPSAETRMPWAIGGGGGAHLLVEPGELEIELFIRARPRRPASEITARLLTPDRQVAAEVVISVSHPSPEPTRSAILRARVDHRGTYALMITAKGDRLGQNFAWAMRTNAAGYVIETSRGHKDERHQEPIALFDADRPAAISFLPRAGTFDIEVEGLPADVEGIALFDHTGARVAAIPTTPEPQDAIRRYLQLPAGNEPQRSARFTVPADPNRGDALWRLHFPRGQAFVNIDGVTRWEAGDRYSDQALWTPDADSWFPFPENRWLITPYQRTVWAENGTGKTIAFQVHNNASGRRTMALALEFPGADWPAELSLDRVTLDPAEARQVEVRFNGFAAGDERIAHLRATPESHPELTTYVTLTVRGGEPPAARPLELPIVLQPFAHENRQFGYLPDYPVDNQLYFDLENRPFVVSTDHLHRQVDGNWVATPIDEAVRKQPGQTGRWSIPSSKIAFDADNDLYLLGRAGSTVALLHSTDGGATFTAYPLPGRESEIRAWDFEQFSGNNVPPGPPPVVRLTRTARDTSTRLRWRSVNDLELFVAEKDADGTLRVPPPLRLSETSLGLSLHSGIPSSVVSRGSKVHVVWAEATDPAASLEEIPGVPAFVATYDRETGDLGKPVFMSFGPPPNDGHNTPSITIDSQGYLHIVVGTHGRPFQYLRSREPNDAYAGWTEAIRTSEDDLRQTYVGLVCDADDTLHLVFRLWRTAETHLDGALWAALVYQRKRAGHDWEEPVLLVAPPLSEYSIYYHRLTIDREGTLFLSYDYWSTHWFYRNDQRGPVAAGSGRPGRGWGRAVLASPDAGRTWSLW